MMGGTPPPTGMMGGGMPPCPPGGFCGTPGGFCGVPCFPPYCPGIGFIPLPGFRPIWQVPVVVPPVVIQQPVGGSDIDAAPPAAEWGLKITQLAPDGPAAKAQLQVGHIIVMAGNQRTQSFEQLTGVLAQATEPIEVIIFLEDTRQLVKTVITPVGGKIGVAVEPVQIK